VALVVTSQAFQLCTKYISSQKRAPKVGLKIYAYCIRLLGCGGGGGDRRSDRGEKNTSAKKLIVRKFLCLPNPSSFWSLFHGQIKHLPRAPHTLCPMGSHLACGSGSGGHPQGSCTFKIACEFIFSSLDFRLNEYDHSDTERS
jgi:hypothetical protein